MSDETVEMLVEFSGRTAQLLEEMAARRRKTIGEVVSEILDFYRAALDRRRGSSEESG